MRAFAVSAHLYRDGLGRRAVSEGIGGDEEENTAISLEGTEFRDEETRSTKSVLVEPRQHVTDRWSAT